MIRTLNSYSYKKKQSINIHAIQTLLDAYALFVVVAAAAFVYYLCMYIEHIPFSKFELDTLFVSQTH